MRQVVARWLQAGMERRARRLVRLLRPLAKGELLDVGSGTGHVAALLPARPADVTDMHLVGPPPVLFDDRLPFPKGRFDTSLLLFVLGYPRRPERLLEEARRVARRVVVVQTVATSAVGHLVLWLREWVTGWLLYRLGRWAGLFHQPCPMGGARLYAKAELLRLTPGFRLAGTRAAGPGAQRLVLVSEEAPPRLRPGRRRPADA